MGSRSPKSMNETSAWAVSTMISPMAPKADAVVVHRILEPPNALRAQPGPLGSGLTSITCRCVHPIPAVRSGAHRRVCQSAVSLAVSSLARFPSASPAVRNSSVTRQLFISGPRFERELLGAPSDDAIR